MSAGNVCCFSNHWKLFLLKVPHHGVELIKPQDLIHLSQKAVSDTFQQNQAQTVDHLHRFKTCCIQRMAQNLKCILCRITFYFEKIFIYEPRFQWKRQKGLAGTWLELAFPFYLLFICMCWRLYFVRCTSAHGTTVFGLWTVLYCWVYFLV